MNIGKTGVFVFTDALSAPELAHCARRVEELGYGTLWYPEAFGYESFTVAGYSPTASGSSSAVASPTSTRATPCRP